MDASSEMGAKRRKTLPLPAAWKNEIEAARIAKGMTRERAAIAAGMAASTWTRIMKDEGSWDSVLRVSRFLGIAPPQLSGPVSEDDAVGQLAILARRLHQLGADAQLADLVEAARAQVQAADRVARLRGLPGRDQNDRPAPARKPKVPSSS